MRGKRAYGLPLRSALPARLGELADAPSTHSSAGGESLVVLHQDRHLSRGTSCPQHGQRGRLQVGFEALHQLVTLAHQERGLGDATFLAESL